MLFTDSVFVGIDLSPSHKSFTYAALDKGLHILALADGDMEEVTAFLAGQQSATVAVNAPAGVNSGVVREAIKKEMLTPNQIRRTELRLAEHELRQRGITVTKTASNAASCPEWMQNGFTLYRKLEKMGFKNYPEKESLFQILETNSHACFCVLSGQSALTKPSLESRLQRHLILYECGMYVKDPMDFFEEITRYKISKGIWPVELLYLPGQLDALVAAYTAWLAVEKQGRTIRVGDVHEGQIILPVAELKDKY